MGGDAYDNLLSIKEVSKNVYALGGFSWSGISGDKVIASRGEADYWIVILNDTKNLNNGVSSVTASDLKNITDAKEKIFTVYPNPAKDILNVRSNGKATFVLTDQTGKKLLSKEIENSAVINIAHLPAGLYYLKNNNTGITKKIIITR